mgnify:CR=1 FL=1
MKRDLVRDAQKEVGRLATDAAEQFDSSIVHNRVSEDVEENDQLRQVVNVMEQASDINENYDQWQPVRDLGAAVAKDLDGYVDDIVEMAVAEACVEVVQDAADWAEDVDWYDEDDIKEAISEAREWLAGHDDARDRLNIELHDDGTVAYTE